MKNKKAISFNRLIALLCKLSSKNYVLIVGLLIVIGAICNCVSNKPLPMFWALVCGFAFVIYMDIHSIRQSESFHKKMMKNGAADFVLRDQKEKLGKLFYSGRNWIIIFLVPTLIVPAVIYIIQYPLGLPIKIYAYTMLYFIIALCGISYSEYVYLIIFSFRLYKNAKKIQKYNHDRPHKTEWLESLARITNKQSNYFFITGTNFIFLLALITLSGKYDVSLENKTSLIFVSYLWMIIAIGIVLMFTFFSLCSYLFIKLLVDSLTQKSICNYEIECKIYEYNKKKTKCKEMIELIKIKILLLEQTPSYPHKPLSRYAVSCIVGIINFGATLESIRSLHEYVVSAIH